MNDIQLEKYKKIITINDHTDKNLVTKCVNLLLTHMFEVSQGPEFFIIRLTDARDPQARELVCEWTSRKEGKK